LEKSEEVGEDLKGNVQIELRDLFGVLIRVPFRENRLVKFGGVFIVQNFERRLLASPSEGTRVCFMLPSISFCANSYVYFSSKKNVSHFFLFRGREGTENNFIPFSL